jgi:acyl carrier protein
MTDEQVIEIINQSLAEEFELDPDKMNPQAHLIEDLEFDSLDFVDMVVTLQKAFGVKLREEPRVREVRTLGDLHRLIVDKRRQMEASSENDNDTTQ